MKIIGTGSALPGKVVTNEMLSGFLDTSDEWIKARTGVSSRYVISEERLEDLAIEAARKALDDASIDPADLDFIICSNVVNEYVTPQLSCIIQGGIGASCPCMDINCACAGFIHALEIAESFYKAGRVNNVLIVCAEEPTRMTDWSDRRTCVLFGDGAGAAVLGPGYNIRSIRLSASSAADKLWQYRILHPTPYITKDEHDVPLQMKGQDVFKFAVKAASSDISRTLEDAGVSADDVDHYLVHQANIRIISSIEDYLQQPKEKFPVNISDHGNSSSASCPILLDECRRNGRFREGDLIAMSAFGAGFVSGAVLFEW
jgi:3-oxoacyl-[acyl-carrier-protein] synthase-3